MKMKRLKVIFLSLIFLVPILIGISIFGVFAYYKGAQINVFGNSQFDDIKNYLVTHGYKMYVIEDYTVKDMRPSAHFGLIETAFPECHSMFSTLSFFNHELYSINLFEVTTDNEEAVVACVKEKLLGSQFKRLVIEKDYTNKKQLIRISIKHWYISRQLDWWVIRYA